MFKENLRNECHLLDQDRYVRILYGNSILKWLKTKGDGYIKIPKRTSITEVDEG